MDLVGPMHTKSRGDKRYVLMVMDDFSRYFFVSFLREKSWAIEHLKSLFNRIQVEIAHPIVRIRSSREREFDNVDVDSFVSLKELNMSFQLLELLNKMEWLKEKIECYKKWLG